MMIGQTIDRYEIVEELGHGGMSVVYRGRDRSLEREVAVKLLHNHLAKKLENRLRFHREAKAIARLRHPNILEVYDFSSEDAERSYIVMEYVQGENLRQFVARAGTPPPEYAVLFAHEICTALEHAHDHGIIHRDLKPENVMVSLDGEIKLMDFGIAHVIDAETMTATGSLLGSPAHMAPEIIDGKKADRRADIFALGTVLYWLATGSLPFEGTNAPQVLRRVLEGEYTDPLTADPRVGQPLARVIVRCLAREPDDRYDDVAEVRRALDALIAPMGWTDPRAELRGYIRRPEETREAFDERIVERLMERAKNAQDRRDVPAAIALFNRILAYDPENRAVQKMLDSLCRRRSLLNTLPWVVVAAIVAVGVGGYAYQRATTPRPPPSLETRDAVVPPAKPEPVTAPVAVAPEVEDEPPTPELLAATESAGDAIHRARAFAVSRLPVDEKKLTAPVLPAPPVTSIGFPTTTTAPAPDPKDVQPDAGEKAVPTYRYSFSVLPAGATFFIDGRAVGVFEARKGVELTPGVHQLSATSRGTKPWSSRIEVQGPQAGGPMPVVLAWKDGRVRVDTNRRAMVWIGGSSTPIPIGANGSDATLSFPFGPADSTESVKRITLRIAPHDNLTKRREVPVTVRPGALSTVQVNFDSRVDAR